MQAQAFTQIPRAHSGGLQAVQQAQGHGKVVHQIFNLLLVVTGQAPGQVRQGVFQIPIVVQRLDQETQRAGIRLAQTQAQRLAVQMGLQRLLGTRQFGGIGVFTVAKVVGAGLGVGAPLAIIGHHLCGSVAIPVGLIVTAA